jgi:pimeloyl-ACP methyl ester carboxylesterase
MAKARRRRELATRAFLLRTSAMVIALTSLAAGLLSGCSTSAAPGKPPDGFVPCKGVTGTEGFCRSIPVPLDWANPSGLKIAVWVTVLPARTSPPAPDPMFYIEGGPGGAATQEVSWAAASFKQINETHDLVFVDQRGTGNSDYLSCSGLDEGTAAGALRTAVQLCLASFGTAASHFTTAAAAHDLDYVRSALGYKKIDLYGVSYGVSLGLAYLQRYGAHVRSAVFDSGSLLNTPLWQEAPVHAQQAFDLLVRRCDATPACAKVYNPAADLATVLAQLKPGPAGSVATLLSDLDDYYLGKSTAAVLLPADLHLAARSGLSALLHRRKNWFESQLSPTAPPLMPLTVECGDAWAAINPKAIGNSIFAPMMVARSAYFDTLCPIWPHDPGVSGTVHTSDPILFLNGTADPTDPPANVAAAKATMPNALLVAIPRSAHWVLNASWNWGSTTPACLLSDVATFIDTGRPANRSTWAACTASLVKYVPSFPPAP